MDGVVRRDHSLDGLRGVASVSVAIFHFFCAFAPRMVPEYHAEPWQGSDTPLAVLYNGGFAVAIFFVLSGFVLSRSASVSERPLWFSLAQRYVRLAAPVLASTLFGWALLALWHEPRNVLRTVVDSRWQQFAYGTDLPGLGFAIYHGAVRVFIEGNSFFNNALWTMKIELIGSCLIYVAYAPPLMRYRFGVLASYIVGAIVAARPEYAAFAIGALMQEAWAAKVLPSRFAWAALAFGIVFGAMMPDYAARVLPFDVVVPAPQFKLGEAHKFWHVIAATAIMYAVLNLQAVRGVLVSTTARFLGRISFGLYLVHVPLIFTLFAAIYLRLPADEIPKTISLLALYLPTTVAAGYLFTVAVDEPLLRFLRSVQPRGLRSQVPIGPES